MKFTNPFSLKSLVVPMLVASSFSLCSAAIQFKNTFTDKGELVKEGLDSLLAKQQYATVFGELGSHIINTDVMDWLEDGAKEHKHVACMYKELQIFAQELARGLPPKNNDDAIDLLSMMLVALVITKADVDVCTKTITEEAALKNVRVAFDNLLKDFRTWFQPRFADLLSSDKLSYTKILAQAEDIISKKIAPAIMSGSMPNPAWVCYATTGWGGWTSYGSFLIFNNVAQKFSDICVEALKDLPVVEHRATTSINHTLQIFKKQKDWTAFFNLRTTSFKNLDIASNKSSENSSSTSSTSSSATTDVQVSDKNDEDDRDDQAAEGVAEEISKLIIDGEQGQSEEKIVVAGPTVVEKTDVASEDVEKKKEKKGKKAKKDKND